MDYEESPYIVEIEAEVRAWLEDLPVRLYLQVEEKVDMLADAPTTLGAPQSRHLGGKLRELRFRLGGRSVRVTYWLAPARRIVLLTVFHKTKMREAEEVERAHRVQKQCEAEHGQATQLYTRHTEVRRP
ncbi:type II toxin-antitoxin system RelE/ParE family toxin [Streptomyces sp. B22F1]|uniref:type II toxin-antitoxin system RelE/ParE family toxin n=1 Tax=Streptomyces sp. B22F1 TaxID=3153566 RepID=UPI00325EDC87